MVEGLPLLLLDEESLQGILLNLQDLEFGPQARIVFPLFETFSLDYQHGNSKVFWPMSLNLYKYRGECYLFPVLFWARAYCSQVPVITDEKTLKNAK